MNSSTPSAGAAPADFDFLLGHWQVQHQRLKERLAGCNEWTVFDGLVSNHQVMGGRSWEVNWIMQFTPQPAV
jgi:hypothetical protein